ncbi:MAG: Fpg/Nei family DNA glycosylase [Nocardioidaceae bacterium]
MPEGHTLYRLAASLRAAFAGEQVRVTSPQGRFTDSAALITGHTVTSAESAGKHLFVGFDNDLVLHVHLGLIGKFEVQPGAAPPPVGAIRVRIEGGASYAELRGATVCELVSAEKVASIIAALGPDPLRADADPELAYFRLHRSDRPIGALLMDQKVLAGVGNVYRAESLFRAHLHPMTPGKQVSKRRWRAIWSDLVALMAYGVDTGRIDTVTPEHEPEAMGRAPRVDDHGGEVYVYRRQGQPCHICGSVIRTAVLEGRNLFWCPKCQRRRQPAAGRVSRTR